MNPKILPLPQEVAARPPIDWKQRQDEVRENEWRLYKKAVEVIERRLDRFLDCPFEKFSIRDLCEILQLALNLGRRAVGLPPIDTKPRK